MKYPSLMRLRVARRHRRGTPEEPLTDGEPLLLALRADLDRIEGLGKQLLRLAKLERRVGHATDHLSELRDLMNLDARPIVLDRDGEWHRRLTADILHDRELIAALLPRSAPEPWRPPVDMKCVAEREIPEPPERCGPPASVWHEALVAADSDLWLGHVQSKIGERARRHRLPTLEWKYAAVAPAADPGRSARPVQAWAIIAQSSDGRTLSAHVWPGRGALEGTLWFEVPQQGARRRGAWLRAHGAEAAWQSLFEPPPGGPACLLTEVVELLREAWVRFSRCAPESVDLRWLCEDLAAYQGGPTDLLCHLATHIGALSTAERAEALGRLLEIATNTEWRLLASCLPRVVAKLNPDPKLSQDLYSAMWHRCPLQPRPRDILALTSARTALRVHWPLLPFVRAVCASTLAETAVKTAGPEMRDMIEPGSARTVVPPGVVDATIGAVRELGATGGLRRPLNELRPIVALLDADASAALLRGVGLWLSQQLAAGEPGMWTPDAEAMRRIEGVEIFQALTGGRPPWNIDALAWLRLPLPQATDGAPRCYPGTFWPLLRRWLEGDGLAGDEGANYQADVACWWLRSYCEAAAGDEPLTRCGQWLASSPAQAAALRTLADSWISNLNHASPMRAVKALALLVPGMVASSAGVLDAIQDSVQLEVWKEWSVEWIEAVSVRWKQWVEAAVNCGGREWKPAWAALALRGVLFDPEPKRRERWTGHLDRHGSDLGQADSDVCLADFEWRVLRGSACSLTEAFGRLAQVHRWRRAGSRRASRLDWLSWCSRVQTLAPHVIPPATAFRLRVAALCRARDPLGRGIDATVAVCSLGAPARRASSRV